MPPREPQVQTSLRLTATNHVRLRQLADDLGVSQNDAVNALVACVAAGTVAGFLAALGASPPEPADASPSTRAARRSHR